jgi:PIN like domain
MPGRHCRDSRSEASGECQRRTIGQGGREGVKNSSFEYYPPSPDFYETLWKECIFVFDANVLLNLYKYSQPTSDELLGLVEQLGDRVWIPYQVAREYQKNRPQVILSERKFVSGIKQFASKAKKTIIDALALDREGGSFFDLQSISGAVDKAFAEIEGEIERVAEKLDDYPDADGTDAIRDALERLFSDRVGEPWVGSALLDAYDEAERRLRHRVPPGYEDLDKDPPDRYGDAIVWAQMIQFARERKKPIVFVTAEKKSDWWLKLDGVLVGPRPELRREMLHEANVEFHMYRVLEFLKHAREFRNAQIEPEAVEEIARVQGAEDKAEATTLKNYIRLQREVVSAKALQDILAMSQPVTAKALQDMAAMYQPISAKALQDIFAMSQPISAKALQDILAMYRGIQTKMPQDLARPDEGDNTSLPTDEAEEDDNGETGGTDT